MKRTALAITLTSALLLSSLAGILHINLADANPNWIDFSKPTINILSPINQKYNVTEIPLNFTVSERVSKLTYSLDGQAKVTISGNTNLTGLSGGSHNLTVYATDLSGNTGTSETIYFTIAEEPKPEPFPATLIVAPIASVAVAGAGLLVYFKKRKH
jgi:hypothetical protein